MEEAVPPQVVALLAGLAQALVAELVLGLVLVPRVERTLQERTLQGVQAAQCQAPLAKVPTQEWAAEAPRAPARPIPAQAQIPKSAGSSLEWCTKARWSRGPSACWLISRPAPPRHSHRSDPAFFHFGGGLAVRNLCRERLSITSWQRAAARAAIGQLLHWGSRGDRRDAGQNAG